MITEYCIGCIHLDEDLVACLYYLNRRVSRAYTMGEPGGDGCRCRELGPRGDKMRKQIADEVRGRLRFAEALEKRAKLNAHRLKLYKAGCTDAEIAGCLDLCNELRCITIVVLNFSVLWNVTAQSQYILNPLCL